MAKTNYCTIGVLQSKALTALAKKIGANENLLYSVVSDCISYDSFTPGFINFYKETEGEEPDMNSGNGIKVANRMIKYYQRRPSLDDTVELTVNDDKIKQFRYQNATEREEGKQHMSVEMLQQFIAVQAIGTEIKGNPIDYYAATVSKFSTKLVLEEIAKLKNKPYNEVYKEYNEAEIKYTWLEQQIGDDMSETVRVRLAVYRELHSSPKARNQYIDELFCNPILQPLFAQNRDALDAFNENVGDTIEAEGNVEGGEVYVTQVDDTDRYIAQANSHAGLHSTFMKHISMRVKSYFDTLEKMASPTKVGDDWVKDTNNIFGIPETLGAEACCSMLYGGAPEYNSVPSMIDYVERVAKTVKGFEAFAKFAEDLRQDPDFAYECFSIFAKTVMDKIQVVVNNGQCEVRVSNQRANKHRALLFTLMNDIKGTAINEDLRYFINDELTSFNNKVDVLDASIKMYDKITNDDKKAEEKLAIDDDFDKLIAKLTELVKVYYPSISDTSILSYIELHNNAGDNYKIRLNNIKVLANIIKDTAEASEATYNKYVDRDNKIKEYIASNKKYEADVDAGRFRHYDDYLSVEEVYTIDFISQGQKKAYIELTNALAPYSNVKLQLTTPNVHGNNQSSVINNSFITNLKKILDSSHVEYIRDKNGKVVDEVLRNEVLERWGADKLRDKTYRYSTLLLEQVDEDGKINEGIFRYNANGDLVLTKRGPELLDVALFDGSGNIDKGSNASYADMTQGSFFPTAFMQFFKTEQLANAEMRVARYFPRIPSDSTTMFSIQGVRYDTSDLFVIEDENKLVEVANEAINSIPIVSPKQYNPEKFSQIEDLPEPLDLTVEEYREEYNIDGGTTSLPKQKFQRDEEAIAYLILGNRDIPVPNTEKASNKLFTKEAKGNKWRIAIDVGNNRYLFVGDRGKVGRLDMLKNPKLKAIIPKRGNGALPELTAKIIRENITDRLKRGNIRFNGHQYNQPNQKINRNSRMFRLYRQQFKQELLEIALNLDYYFKLDKRGWLRDSDGYNESYTKEIQVKDGVNPSEGYLFYHIGKGDKEVLVKKGNKYYLNGNGFHSSKFTLSVKDENGNEVKRNFLDEVITTDIDSFEEDAAGNPVYYDDGRIHLLYGGVYDNFLHVKRNTNGDIIGIDYEAFTDAQKELIDQQLEKYITEYISQCEEYMNQKRQFIKDVEINRANIIEYFTNHNLFLMQADDILDGSSKFYKDAQTGFKRAKEYEGSGVPYGLVDYLASSDDETDPDNSYLNTGTFNRDVWTTTNVNGMDVRTKTVVETNIQDFFNSRGLHNCKQRKHFHAVTVYNTKSTNKPLLESLVKQLVKESNIDENLARDILFGPVKLDKDGNIMTVDGKPDSEPIREGGFQETKVNDAQSYITFEEWIRRIAARGQLKRYMPLIEKLLDPNSIITADDIQEFVQVQKNFYYDLYFDDKLGREVPRQIKNAEMVLIPRFIQGTQLEKVYDLMISAGIDQLNTLETLKAANKDVILLWDNDGNLAGEDSFIEQARAKKQKFNYKYLYTQQETPQHVNTENKAGIQIIKKIIDNIPKNHPLYAKKEEYMQLFVQNIRDSYDTLLNELDIPRDEYGNIDIDPETHKIKGLNIKVFYDKLRDEMRRLGLDSNMIDYVTIDEDTQQPRMPAHINNVISKLESIVQSVFNSSITRQTLPGFHAAQVTNVGWRALSEDVTGVSYAKDLKYHPDAYRSKEDPTNVISERQYNDLSDENKKNYTKTKANWIEVMVPISVLGINRKSSHYINMTDEEILKELEKEGLDFVMGYRIPTEGKQSVCNMKIVGFVDDAYGSTIIVPNEWVAQTGSDFDIDSVYGINYKTYKSKNGKINKIKYFDDNSKPSIYDYYDYVFSNPRLLRKYKSSIIKDIRAREKELFEGLPRTISDAIKDSDASVKALLAEQYIEVDKELQAKEILDGRIDTIDFFIETYASNPAAVQLLQPFRDVLQEIKDYYDNPEIEYRTDEIAENSPEEQTRLSEIEELAKAEGVPTYEDYKTSLSENPIANNSRGARNNRILDNMKSILLDPLSLEENLSRSNFDDVIYWRNYLMNDNVRKARENRSPYNPIDQFRNQEDAISGADLKGLSVALDTFCSVCNTAQPKISRPIYIVYDSSDFNDLNSIKERFDDTSISEKTGKTFTIRHNTYGWSNDNRAVNGKLLTAHSSQTTAHILDAIKEGSIPNVNVYTFPVYKTFLNIGSDYKTAISFIMQPGIARIVDAYNANNSVFSDSNFNPQHQAIKRIAKELIALAGDKAKNVTPIKNNDSVIVVLAKLNTLFKDEFNELFHQDGDPELHISFKDADLSNLAINVPLMYERLKGIGTFKKGSSPVKELLFDLGVMLQFHRLHQTSGSIGDIARCCNPDKFGAKQTIFETNKVFDDIHDCIYDPANVLEKRQDPILYVDGNNDTKIHLLESIYPGVADGTDINPASGMYEQNDIMKSSYPIMFAYLKYATAASTVIAKELFETESINFVRAIKGITTVMTGYRPVLDEATYTDLKKYMLSHYYNQVPSIKYPLTLKITEQGYKLEPILGIVTEEDGKQITPKEKEGSALVERSRIYGINFSPSFNFDVVDITNPTQEEIDKFAELSPAQKVKWLQKTLRNSEDTIFGLLEVSLFNDGRRKHRAGTQTIEFTKENLNPNVVYFEFRKAFYNSNPFIKLAAIDLIKYAVVVEGLRMTDRGVTRVIDNAPLRQEFGSTGLGFVDMLATELRNVDGYGGISDPDIVNPIYEFYLRSHPDCPNIPKLVLNKYQQDKYSMVNGLYGMIQSRIDSGTEELSDNEAKEQWYEKMYKAGIVSYNELGEELDDKYPFNTYIRIYRDGKSGRSKLYKICKVRDGVILYPLGNLNTNEAARWSIKPDNNAQLPPEVFEALINQYEEHAEANDLESTTLSPLVDNLIAQGVWETYEAPEAPTTIEAAEFDVNDISSVAIPLKNHFANSNDRLLIKSLELPKYIFTPGTEFGSIQYVKLDNGDIKKVKIYKANTDNINEIFLKKDIRRRYILSDEDFEQKIKLVKDKQLAEKIREARDAKLTKIDNMFVVTPILQGLNASTEEGRVISFMRVQAESGDEAAVEGLAEYRFSGAEATETSSTESNVATTRIIAKYANSKAQQLVTDFDHFIPDPENEGNWFAITDERVQPLLQGNEDLLRRYQKLILDATSFIQEYSFYKDLPIDSKNVELKHYVDDIVEAVKAVSDLKLLDASNKLADHYYTQLSANSLVKTQLISINESFYKTYGNMWMFNDVMEAGSPLLQTMLRDVMGNIESKRLAHERHMEEIHAKMDDIRRRAKEDGYMIDINKAIDDGGRRYQKAKPEFRDKLNELVKNLTDAADEFGKGSIEYLRALNEYDTFKAKYVNQKVVPEYYIDKAQWDRTMLNRFPHIFSAYKKIKYEQAEIYDYFNGELNDDVRKRIEELDKQLNALINPAYYITPDGRLESRPSMNDNSVPLEIRQLYSTEAAHYLEEYINAESERNKEYFEVVGAYGFKELVDKNLGIIAAYENRDVNGIPVKPINILMQDPVYADAKNWMRDHTYYRLNPSQYQKDDKDSLYNKLLRAFETLKLSSGGKSKVLGHLIKNAKEEGRNVVDEHGVVDGNAFSADEKEYLKSTMKNGYLVRLPDGTDRRLISSAPNSDTHYNKLFWASVSPSVNMNLGPLPDTPENRDIWLAERNEGNTLLDYFEWLGWMGNEPKRQHYEIITKINEILEPYYHQSDGVVHFDEIPDTEEGVRILNTLADLYQQLRTIENPGGSGENNGQWLDENTEYVTNKAAYIAQAMASKEKHTAGWEQAWKRVNMERNKDGDFVTDNNGKVIPNRRLYSFLKPKGSPGDPKYDQYVDKNIQEAVDIISHYTTKAETVHYKQAQAEAINRAKTDPDFDYVKWYHENHVYNPYTRKYEPLACWVTTEYNQTAINEAGLKGEWVPRGQQRESKVRDGMIKDVYVPSQDKRNHNYDPDGTNTENYSGVNFVTGQEDTEYKNNVEINKYEQEMLDLMQEELIKTARNEEQRKHWVQGWMPITSIPDKPLGTRVATETAKFFGLPLGKRRASFAKHNDLDYVNDELPPLPMSQTLLRSKRLGSIEFNEVEPKKHNYIVDGVFDEAKYKKDHDQWQSDKDAAIAKNKEVHKQLLNRDWYNVFDAYMEEASRYNSIQDNKYKLYYLYEMLKRQKAYMREHGAFGKLKKVDSRKQQGATDAYETAVDDNLVEQYATFMQRLMFDQWKDDEGILTTIGNTLQGVASSSYMMLNFKAGISNVTLGSTGMFAEAFGKEVLGIKHWRFGQWEWTKGMVGMIRGAYSTQAFNKQDAVVKYFKVVDYDEWRGISTEFDMEKLSENIRNFMFSPQTIGEHFMQNSILFGMLKSHKIVDIENDPLKIGKTYMSEQDYINYRMAQEMNNILTEEQQNQFAKFKQEVKSDKDTLADYAWWRRDITTDFIYLRGSKEQVNDYIKSKDEHIAKFKKEFAEFEDLYSQCELGANGRMTFREGSVLAELNEQFVGGEDVTAAEALLGRFSERVRKINNRIHGVYNKMGRAWIERKWYGSILMQYHKHLPMGLIKRYRARGYFNETRGTVEKGMIASVIDFLSLNADRVAVEKGLGEGAWTRDEINAVKSVQFMLAHTLDFLIQVKTTWQIIPYYERANIKRNIGDAIGVLAGLLTIIGLIAYDDDNDNPLYNLWLYEADRLQSEAFLYNPIGLWTETKTLMSTPIAAQSIVNDLLKAIMNIGNYSETFQSGRFAGQNKLLVYLTRRIPVYGGVKGILDIADNNHYYKLGDTAATLIPTRDIGEWVGSWFR